MMTSEPIQNNKTIMYLSPPITALGLFHSRNSQEVQDLGRNKAPAEIS